MTSSPSDVELWDTCGKAQRGSLGETIGVVEYMALWSTNVGVPCVEIGDPLVDIDSDELLDGIDNFKRPPKGVSG